MLSLIVAQAIIVLSTAYKTYNSESINYAAYVPLNIVQNSMNIIVSFIVLGLLVGAFYRLNRLVQHDGLVLSKL